MTQDVDGFKLQAGFYFNSLPNKPWFLVCGKNARGKIAIGKNVRGKIAIGKNGRAKVVKIP